MPTIRVKITDPNFERVELQVSYASAWDDGRGPEKTVALLNKKARDMVLRSRKNWKAPTYELASEADYRSYYEKIAT